jgi:conjugal transfer pilus assembly protein TraI
MFNWLFRSRIPPVSAASGGSAQPRVDAPKKLTAVSGVVYPPQDPGLPITPVDTLLGDQAQIFAMLRTHAALPGGQFKSRFEDPIRRIASYVNVLPGSPATAFSGAGGLFRACVENAFAIFRASDGRIFTGDKGVEDRHILEVRWRYVCFLAGLLYPIGRPLEAMNVMDSSGCKWAVELEGLADWAGELAEERVYASWSRTDAQPGPAALTATFALKIVGRENVEWLNGGSPLLVQALVDIVAGSNASRDSIAGSLVREMWAAVREREESRLPQNYGQLVIGSDIAPYLLDAIVSLFKSKWKLNQETTFADQTSIYIEWPAAAEDIIAFCRGKGYSGIPSADGVLLAMLATTGIIESQGEGLAIQRIANADGEIVNAVKLAKPGLVLGPDETLASVAATRPIAMSAVLATDPLTESTIGAGAGPVPSASVAKKSRSAQPPPTLQVLEPDAVIAASEASDAGDDGPTGELAAAASVAAAPQEAEAAGATQASKPKKQEPKTEGVEIKFRDMLPKEVADTLPAHDREYLGRMVHFWRTKGGSPTIMRFCEHGAAIEMSLLASVSRDPSRFLATLAEKGMLYTNPATPRKLLYKVAATEGGSLGKECFILAHHTARKLGLQ